MMRKGSVSLLPKDPKSPRTRIAIAVPSPRSPKGQSKPPSHVTCNQKTCFFPPLSLFPNTSTKSGLGVVNVIESRLGLAVLRCPVVQSN